MSGSVAQFTRVWEYGPVTGTGAIALPGVAEAGYRTAAATVPTGTQINYRIVDRTTPTIFEGGYGVVTISSGVATIARNPVETSNANALVSFTGNVCDIVIDNLTPVVENNGAQPGGAIPLTNKAGFLDESWARYPIFNLKPGTQLQSVIAGKVGIYSQVNAPTRYKIGVIGDSTGMGYGGLPNDFLEHSITAYIAKGLTAAGYRSTYDSNFGTGNETDSDLRLVETGAAIAAFPSLAGYAYQIAAAGTIAFTPINPWNTVDILSYNQGGSPSASLSINGGTSSFATLNQSALGANPTIQTFSTGATPAIQTLTITWIAGPVDILGIACYDTTKPSIEVYNFCGGSQPTATYAALTPAYGALNAILQTGVKTIFYELGINDAIANVPVATFKANVLACVNALQGIGIDVILMMPPYIPGATYSTTLFPGYFQALQEIAISNNVPVINWYDRYGNGSALGSNAGQPHPDNAVYQDKANFIVQNIFLRS
jgi:hypothetical protein